MNELNKAILNDASDLMIELIENDSEVALYYFYQMINTLYRSSIITKQEFNTFKVEQVIILNHQISRLYLISKDSELYRLVNKMAKTNNSSLNKYFINLVNYSNKILCLDIRI